MTKHKWYREICAWANGAEIEYKLADETYKDHWIPSSDPSWNIEEYLFRIKPQPKEPQYLYVLREQGKSEYWLSPFPASVNKVKTIGKIKLEQDDEF